MALIAMIRMTMTRGSGQNQGWSTFPSIDGSLRPPWHSSYFDDNDDNDNKIYHERFKTLEILCMIVETMTLEILLFTIRMTIFYCIRIDIRFPQAGHIVKIYIICVTCL